MGGPAPPRQLCLSDSADQTLRCATGDGGVAFNDLVLPVGDYGVSLSGDPDPSAPYLLRVDITAPEVAGYEAEPNETIGLASPLDVSGEFPTIRGRLDGPDQDMFRFTVTGEPQLWDISASGPGLARLDVVNVTGTAETTRAAVDGEVTIYDAFFLPGNHWVQIGGTGGEYVVTAAPRGPPDPAAEHEPNDGPDRSQPIRLGEKRTGRLIDPADVDIYRFSLQNDGHVLIDVAVPPDGLFTARLEANGMEVARVTAALPGDPITYDAFLSPGDYTLWLSPTTPSTGRYRLSVTPLDPLTVPDDAEPNDAPADARPMPADLSVSGTLDPRLANGADVDTYRITPLPAETTATIQVTGDAEVTMWVPATPGVPETALTLTPATGDGRFDVTLPGASDILVRLSGQGAYRLVLLTGDAVAAATPGPTTGDRRGPGSGLPESGLPGRSRGPGDGTSVELDTPAGLAVDLLLTVVADGSVAAYWPQGQRLDATLTITNTGDASIGLDLDATTGHYAWVVALDAAAVTLGPGESRTVPVVVRVAPDAWADEPVLVTVRAREDDLQRTASVTVIPGRDAAPLNSEPFELLPPSMLGGLNVAWTGLGGVPVTADATSATTEAEIYDGFSPAAGGWSADATALPAELTIDLAGDDPVPVAGIALLSLGGFEVTERLRGFDLELSLDGQTFTPALSAELSAIPVEQVFALDAPVHARFARLRVTSGQVATASRVRIAQWKVIADPGWSPPGEEGGLELAAPGGGGHLVAMAPLPPGSVAVPPLPADGTTRLTVPAEPGQTISWVVGFRDDRAAQITAIAWSDPDASDPAVRFDQVTVEVSV
ncbi:MAG: discoidin domain-containing protein, partial [Thermomicrobiales bacterium]